MPKQREVAHRGLLAICLASLCWAFSFGAGAPLAPLWLHDRGYTPTYIGINTGAYYFGIVVAAGLVPWLMQRLGRGCPLVGMVLTSAMVAVFPHGGGLVLWYSISFCNGV